MVIPANAPELRSPPSPWLGPLLAVLGDAAIEDVEEPRVCEDNADGDSDVDVEVGVRSGGGFGVVDDMAEEDEEAIVGVVKVEEDSQLNCPPLPAEMYSSTLTGTSGAYSLHIDARRTADLVRTSHPQFA